MPVAAVGHAQDLGAEDPADIEPAQRDLGRRVLLEPAVGEEERHGAGLVVPGRAHVDHVGGAEAVVVVAVAVDLDLEDPAGRELRHPGERPEDRLPPGRPRLLAADRRDHVDELRLVRDLHPVAVPQQRVEQRADDHRVGDAVLVLDDPRVLAPARLLDAVRLVLAVQPALVPDVPLVEREVDALAVLQARAGRVRGRHDRLDEEVHVDGAREEAPHVALVLLVVGVQRDVVDDVVRVAEHGLLPLAEGRHARVGAAARDQLDARIHQPHGLARLLREAAVLVGGLVPDLPRPVHLVAEAPELDVEGLLSTVPAPHVGVLRSAGVVRVLHERARRVDAARAEVDGLHHLDARGPRPAHELVQAERVGLHRVPGTVESARPVLDGAHAVLPVVAGDEVAAGVPDDGRAELPGEVEHVLPVALGRRGRVAGLVDAGVDAAAHVLDERAEEPAGHVADGEVAVDGDAGAGHGRPPGREARARASRAGWVDLRVGSVGAGRITARRTRWSICP